jgi:radical SAM superfamily enzyme YgiQ (UPF0313 family)
MEKVLFIVPPAVKYEEFINPDYNIGTLIKKNGSFANVLTEMPLGILSMSAYLKDQASVETKLIDFNVILNKIDPFKHQSFREMFAEYLEALDYEPTVIGISSLFTPSYQSLLDIARCCKKRFCQSLIVAGGGIPTNMYRNIFEASKDFDALCFGEGELPLLGLIKAKDKRDFLEEHHSWITRKKSDDGSTFDYCYIENLDDIPFLDYELIDKDDYGLNPLISTYAGVENRRMSFHVMTSRGCPHHCCFCASHSIHGRRMRFYSLDRVREDFTRLKNQFQAQTFIFQDDHLANIKQRTLKILDMIKDLKVTAIFQNGIALYTLERELLEAYKNVGVNQMVLAVESGSERVLKEIIHKPLQLDIVKRVADDCRDLDIYTDVNILIGFPGENKHDIDEARCFLKSINANWFRVVVATPLVGSEMFRICVDKGYLKHGHVDSNYKKAVIDTEDFTAEWIQETAYLLNLELNFVHNSDMKFGRYQIALKGFANALRAKPDHAFAFYYSSACYAKMGNTSAAKQSLDSAKAIVSKDSRWKKYFDHFELGWFDYNLITAR